MLTVNILTVNTTAMLERDDIAVIMTGIIRESSTSAPNALETLSHSIGASEMGFFLLWGSYVRSCEFFLLPCFSPLLYFTRTPPNLCLLYTALGSAKPF